MGKHSKNQTTRPFLTADERRKLTGEHGTHSSRLGSDSQLSFDQCRLCLAPLAKEAVASPSSGALFCRACILEHLLAQRTFITERLAAWEVECAASVQRDAAAEAAQHASAVARFVEAELGSLMCGAGGGGSGGGSGGGGGSSRMDQRSEAE